ncbi:hypothetical protein WJU23_04975 [Prosthecobacter sp. SYSU 5D2]|uniref:hypothetical protein n=1 Tax=Prosthecobacter sp. SYSU 5D2 TaxID=3134134 RepID=UPI0031FE6C7A
MKLPCLLLSLSLGFLTSNLPAATPDYQPELFKSTKLVYEDTFDGPLNTDFWEVRQSSTWEVKDGILTGSQSSKEFQEKMIAKGDKAHAGFKPVIWLHKVPENFVCTLRMRYNAEAYHPKFPLLDLGHHVHTLVFGEKKTTLTIKKNVETVEIEEPLLPLNEWVDIAIELKKGTLLLSINGKKHLFTSPHIDMAGQQQIDFKAVDLGTCQIDHIKLWEGQ